MNKKDDNFQSEEEIIAGRYRIESCLGRGGSGIVHRAQDIVLKRDVAVKTVNKNLLSDKDLVRFQSEAKAMAKVSHQNVVEVYDFGINERGDPYLVIEYVNGITLESHLKRKNQLEFEEALALIVQVLSGLKAIHDAQLIHRDLKPENIMIEKRENKIHAKLLDFGVARNINLDDENFKTQTGVVKGSPLYMSPEQVKGEHPDKESDIYSIGCLIYTLISGKPPFSGDTVFDIMQMHLKSALPKLTSPEIPAGFQELLDKMTAKDPSKRIAKVEDVLSEINKFIRDPEEELTLFEPEKPAAKVIFTEKDNEKKNIALIIILVGVLLTVFIMLSKPWRLFISNEPDYSNTFLTPDFGIRDGAHSFIYMSQDADRDLESFSKTESTKPGNIICVIIARDIDQQNLERLLTLEPEYIGAINSNLDEKAFEIMSRQPSVKDVRIFKNPAVTKAGIRHLKKLELTGLALRQCKLTNDCLKEISTLERLKILDIEENEKITADGLVKVSKLPQLRKINLYGCSIKNNELEDLKKVFGKVELQIEHETDAGSFRRRLKHQIKIWGNEVPTDISKFYINNRY